MIIPACGARVACVSSHYDDEQLVAALRAALSVDRVLDSPFEKVLYAKDASAIAPEDPGVVCLATSTAEVAAAVAIANRFGRSITPRGSGTGLAGGTIPLERAVVITTTKMNRVLEVHEHDGYAWVEPGLLNLDLTRAVSARGVHYAPDPSSQQTCSIGGNVGTNAGGPHCLLHGVTSAHIIAIEVVLPNGEIAVLGDIRGDAAGYDLRGVFVGSEGTMGIATKIAVRLTPNPPAIRTLLADFSTIREASKAVSAIIASGLLPAALEMMDANCIRAVENWAHAGLPLDAGAVLLVELEGVVDVVNDGVADVSRICTAQGAGSVRVAADATERALLWKARKSAFGAIANIKPNYYLHDCVVPRTRLAEIMDEVTRIADEQELIVLNVFHAGDGNLHPLLVYDKREPGVVDRVHEAGRQIIEVCIAAGGMLSGEHGIGLEKRDYMPLVFSAIDLDYQARIRLVFDPDQKWNPGKVLPGGSSCGEALHDASGPVVVAGAWV
jgi:glycolate oxidase